MLNFQLGAQRTTNMSQVVLECSNLKDKIVARAMSTAEAALLFICSFFVKHNCLSVLVLTMMDPAAAENFVDDALEPTSQKLEEVGQIPQTNQGGPLTIIARQVILPGKEADFERWIKEVAELQEEFEGFMGNEVIRPVGSGHNEYVSIFRYDKYENLQTWMQSTVRKLWMEKARPFIHEPIKIEFHSTEFWFVLDNTSFTPRREKMVVVTFLVIWYVM
jgi:heme-degrading monooxygenase HmoA